MFKFKFEVGGQTHVSDKVDFGRPWACGTGNEDWERKRHQQISIFTTMRYWYMILLEANILLERGREERKSTGWSLSSLEVSKCGFKRGFSAVFPPGGDIVSNSDVSVHLKNLERTRNEKTKCIPGVWSKWGVYWRVGSFHGPDAIVLNSVQPLRHAQRDRKHTERPHPIGEEESIVRKWHFKEEK